MNLKVGGKRIDCSWKPYMTFMEETRKESEWKGEREIQYSRAITWNALPAIPTSHSNHYLERPPRRPLYPQLVVGVEDIVGPSIQRLLHTLGSPAERGGR